MASAFETTPDGIEDDHIEARRWFQRHANPVPFLVIGALLLTACFGFLGGQPNPVIVAETERARLVVKTPHILRNGTFYETRIQIVPKTALADLNVAISAELWRDITINSAIPAAEKESVEDGMVRMSFGAVPVSKAIDIKFDGQVNPPLVGRNRGSIAVYDGDSRLAAVELDVRVLP